MKVVLLFSLLVLNQEKYLAVFSCEMRDKEMPESIRKASVLFHDVLIEGAQKASSYHILKREDGKNIDHYKCASESGEVDFGRCIGADRVVTCAIYFVDGIYYISLRLYDIHTARMLNTARENMKGDVD